MTSFRVDELPFQHGIQPTWGRDDRQYSNWPVVYVLNGSQDVYVGETLNLAARIRSHAASDTKTTLSALRVVLDETFNKSACLDLESTLIRWLAGDGRFRVLNRNEGITNADYYDRGLYQATFDSIFHELKAKGLFTRTITQIENSDLFKLSPFKALSEDQAVAVVDIVEGLFDDIESGQTSTSVVQGDPGTGKTIVAIYLMKLLKDIEHANPHEDPDADSMFAEFFTDEHAQLLDGLRLETAHDIHLDGRALRWNTTDKDWISARGSLDEVGSIHTVQGYDLNYAGVIIGPDLRLDSATNQIAVDRANYHDKKGKENNPKLGITLTDADLQRYITNVYAVLLTRGIRGTFVYVVDPTLRERLRPYFSG